MGRTRTYIGDFTMNDEEEYILTMPKVRTSDSHYIAWDRENIIHQILTDTQLCEKFYGYPPASRELAEDVASSVEEAIEGLDLKYLKSSMVREFVCLEFLKRGMIEYHNACMRVGTSLHDAHAIDIGDGYGARDNANLQANPETSHKHKADKMSKEQYLLMMPPKVADAHLKSYIHIHDLEYFGSRSFCMDSDLRYLYYYGFMPDGKGSSASVSAPAKNPEVAVLHAVKYLAASQTNFAGGQGYYNFLTFIAPYFEGLDYIQIKQYMQMMVYELTQMMIARGGQVIFSSLQLSPGVPTLWRDVPVVYKGRIWDGEHDVPKRTYGEFEREVRLAFKALMDVMIDGDYWGKPFNFPKPEISIEPDFVTLSDEIAAWDMEHPDIPTYKELYLMAFDLAAKFGTPYFDNQIPAYRGAGKGISCYQCLPEDTIVYIMRDNKPRDVPIKDLLTSDLILTPTRGYQPFEGILSKPYEGEMIKFVMRNGQSYSCTPDHSVVVKTINMPHFVTMPANEVSLDDEMVVLVNGVATSVQIECIHTIPNFRGVVYDPINVPGHQFVIEDGIVTGNCCAYNFSSNIDEDDEFYDKVYFRNGAHFSMGSLQVVTLNCPRAAYDSGGDVEKLVRNLKNYMNIARDVFVIKKRWIDEIIRRNRLPFVVQRPRDPITGEPGAMAVDMDGLVCTIGVLGFNEMVQHVTGYQLHESKVAHKTALYILAELNKHARKLSEESGLKIVVARTPAETTCQRFAVSDLLNPDYAEHARKVVKGDLDAFDRLKKTTRDLPVYYTNGTHVAVDAPISLPERIKIENPFFVMVQGGNIFHVWLGEAHPEPRGLYEFCMNIATQTQIGYFAFTRDMTIPVNRYTWYTEEFDNER